MAVTLNPDKGGCAGGEGRSEKDRRLLSVQARTDGG